LVAVTQNNKQKNADDIVGKAGVLWQSNQHTNEWNSCAMRNNFPQKETSIKWRVTNHPPINASTAASSMKLIKANIRSTGWEGGFTSILTRE
jgi:hypothetical protein